MEATINGLRVRVNNSLTRTVEDWSDVRSHGRARRRQRQGHKQRIRFVQIPSHEIFRVGDTLVMHSEMLRELQTDLDRRCGGRGEGIECAR
jgi:hypothetical protein